MVRELAQPGDMVVCLGAGSITNWANALPAELAELDGRSAAHDGAATAAMSDLARRLPPVRGRLTANAPIGPMTWFRVGGPAEVLFRPADADDLADFLRALPRRYSGHGDRRRLEPAGARRRHPRHRRSGLARGFAEIAAERRAVEAGAGALDLNVALDRRRGRHRRARIPLAASPARSAAACG